MHNKIFGSQHRVTVLRLYKNILRLHQSLPNELQELGNQYVRDEFRRHKSASPEHVTKFMVEWSEYTRVLRQQADGKTKDRYGQAKDQFGQTIGPKAFEILTEEQLLQLYELFSEIQKSSPDSSTS